MHQDNRYFHSRQLYAVLYSVYLYDNRTEKTAEEAEIKSILRSTAVPKNAWQSRGPFFSQVNMHKICHSKSLMWFCKL